MDQRADKPARIDTGFAQGRQFQRAVTLGQAAAVGGDRQRDVAELGCGPAEPAIEQDLPRRAGHEVGASDDLVDPHCIVVGHDGELVRMADVLAGHDEIAAQLTRVELDAAEKQVVPARPDRAGREIARRRADRRAPRASAAARPAQVPGYVGPSSSACGALAARSMSARVQVQG